MAACVNAAWFLLVLRGMGVRSERSGWGSEAPASCKRWGLAVTRVVGDYAEVETLTTAPPSTAVTVAAWVP